MYVFVKVNLLSYRIRTWVKLLHIISILFELTDLPDTILDVTFMVNSLAVAVE